MGRSSMLELLRQIANTCEEETHLHKVLSASLEAKEMQEQADLQLHQLLGAERYRCEAFWITVSNLDDGIAFTCYCYSDTTLGWLLKRSTRYLMSSKKYFRVVHEKKTLFLSSSRKKTLLDLNIIHGDTVEIEGISHTQDNGGRESSKKVTKSKPSRNEKNRNTRGSKQKKFSVCTHVLSDDELADRYKQEHSRSMNPVLEEMTPKLKVIRNRLYSLNTKKMPPKEKRLHVRAISVPRETPINTFVERDGIKKTGTTSYPVLVGEASNLYKTSRIPPKQFTAIDLHGLSKEEALERLDDSLPVWVDAAMRGNNPWVIGVNIICGGGSQILSDVVKKWIRDNPQVANRPKGVA